jgi:hypothetical protein
MNLVSLQRKRWPNIFSDISESFSESFINKRKFHCNVLLFIWVQVFLKVKLIEVKFPNY